MQVPARTAIVAAVVAALAACDRSPATTPTAPTAPNDPASITRVVVVSPPTLAPGATTQLGLNAVYSDGTTRDVTGAATFTGGPRDVIAISPTGAVTALKLGDAAVTGNQGSAARELVVVPDGTFRVVGRVIEEGTSGLPIGGARVEAEGGPVDITDLDGRYRLYGVPGGARLRISKPGYTPREVALAILGHHIENLALAVDGPRLDFAGQYQLTIDAAAECRSQLPENSRTRRYPAAVTQVGRDLRVVFTGARFAPHSGGEGEDFWVNGQVTDPGNVVELRLTETGSCESSEMLVEKVEQGYLEIGGVIELRPGGAGLVGTLRGLFQLIANRQCQGLEIAALGSCRSSSHRVTLTR